MKTQAAILWETNSPWSVEEISLDPPGPGEVHVKLAASGLCHSDEHVVTGDFPFEPPIIGGHEGWFKRSVPASAGSHPATTSCSGSFRAADAAPAAPPAIRTCATSVTFSVWLGRSATARAVTTLGASTWD